MRTRVVRFGASATLVAGVLLGVQGQGASGAEANTITVSPTAAKPLQTYSYSGRAPGCAHLPYSVVQIYSNNSGQYISKSEAGGMSRADGSFGPVSLVVPAKAMRSNIYRPYAGYRYDQVRVEFMNCATLGANLTVLPIRYDEQIQIDPAVPRSGGNVDVVVTHCVGGNVAPFTWVVDVAGSYFPFVGSMLDATTYNGSADLSNGYRGSKFRTGKAHPSQPAGTTDAALSVPCAQSEGPQSVADADHLLHLNDTVDITIAPENGPITQPHSPPPDRSGIPAASAPGSGTTFVPSAVPAAPVAEPVRATPTFVG